MFVPCGRCVACKIMRTHEWAIRLIMEREYWKSAAFVTLTYRDKELPPTLRPRHLQLFFKRLRRDMPDRKIKYFACGEYGDKGGVVKEGPFAGKFVHRPHYHAIIYGLSPTLDRNLIFENWPYADWQELESTARGRNAIGTVTYDSCRYVAGYVQKKLFGKKAKEELEKTGKVQPFSRKSQGLGLQFALDNEKVLKDALCVGNRGYTVALPRYFRDKLEIDPKLIQDKRRQELKEDFDKFVSSRRDLDGVSDVIKWWRFDEEQTNNPLAVANRKQREFDYLAKEKMMRGELEFDL